MTEPSNIFGGAAPELPAFFAIQSFAFRHIQAGDFVVLPPGTPHWFSKIDGSITYVETRFAIRK